MFICSNIRLTRKQFHISSAVVIILIIIFSDTSIHHSSSIHSTRFQTRNHQRLKLLVSVDEQHNKIERFEKSTQSKEPNELFDQRIREFYRSRECKVKFFMTWIAPADSFGPRAILSIESLFKNHKEGCLIILSETLDTEHGNRVLKPLVEAGYGVIAVFPNLPFLIKNTPAERWYNDLRKGKIVPGEIPLAQNLSNLIRLAALYRYGGVYIDTDFIVMKDFSGLRNAIGAQSSDLSGNWTRLNNAVMVFEKGHPLVYKFIEEFAVSFDGNKWGHNGPYLVSRVVEKECSSGDCSDLTVLPPGAFYPVDWTRISGFFRGRMGWKHGKWIEAKMAQLRGESYGVHLWNRESWKMRVEEGSVVARVLNENCIFCKGVYDS